MSLSVRDVMSALTRKGFQKRENDHLFFHLWVDGKKNHSVVSIVLFKNATTVP